MVLKDFWEGFPDRAETSAMDLVLYFSEEAADAGAELQEVLNNALPERRVEVFTDLEEMVTDLRRPEAEPVLVVLVIGDVAELEEFLPLRSLWQDAGIILVLPDETEETLSLAQELNPSYIKSADEDFVELASVIDEILKERRVASIEEEPLPPDHNL
jgi:DNA-binding NarL/FixJ family response regulator